MPYKSLSTLIISLNQFAGFNDKEDYIKVVFFLIWY